MVLNNAPAAGKENENQGVNVNRAPLRSESEVEKFFNLMQQLENYPSVVPDSVTSLYTEAAGFDVTDPRLLRLISLSAQKFITDVVIDALPLTKKRNATLQVKSKDKKDRKLTLTMDDLTASLAEHGVILRKPPYYV